MNGVIQRVIAAAVAAIGLFVAAYSARESHHGAQLLERHMLAPGVITSKQVGAHGSVEYKFSVAGKEYVERGVGGAQRDFGAKVEVYYFPDDPSISSLHDPRVWRSSGWIVVAVPLFISAIGASLALGWIKPRSSS